MSHQRCNLPKRSYQMSNLQKMSHPKNNLQRRNHPRHNRLKKKHRLQSPRFQFFLHQLLKPLHQNPLGKVPSFKSTLNHH
ncbi:hypothetical protein ACFX1S_004886 [Malus domestica]